MGAPGNSTTLRDSPPGLRRHAGAASVAIAAAALLLAVLAVFVQAGVTADFDVSLRMLLYRHASPALTALMRFASFLGSALVWVPGTALLAYVLFRRRCAAAARLLVTTMLGSAALQLALKLLFHRARPAAFFGLTSPSSYSFPSGHALDAFCFYASLSFLAASRVHGHAGRTALWAVCALLILVVGFSRVYLGVHYPSDVLGGYLAGLAWTCSVVVFTGRPAAGPR